MVTRELFLFFLTTSAGQCYYVNTDGRVLTCQPNDKRAWLPQAPDGWREQQLGFGRNMHYWAMNRSYSSALKFVGDGATIIRWLLYTQKGVDTNLYLNINKYNDLNDTYESYYKGEVDLMNNVNDDPLVGITCNVIEGGLLKLLKAYENTPFEIPVDGSLQENINVNINGLIFNAVLKYSTSPVAIAAHGVIIPLVQLSKVGCDAGVIATDQQLTNFDPNNGTAINQLISESTQYCFTYDKAVAVTINANIFFTGSCNNGALIAYTSLGNASNGYQPYNLINTATRANATSAIVATGAITSNTTYTVNQTINLQAGESLFIMLIVEDSSFTLAMNANSLDITFDSQFSDTTVICIKPLDLLTQIVKKICNLAYQYPEINAPFTIQSDLLNQHSNLVLTSGAALRHEAGAVIKTTLSEFFDAMDTLIGASLGNLYTVGTPHGETLFVEKLGYVLDSSATPFDIGEVSKLKITPTTDLYFDMVVVGYPEQKYDEQQGNYEWNTTSKWKAPIHKLNKEYRKVCPYRGDAYGIEYTRTLINTSNSTNNKSDNNTFLLNIDYSQIQAAQAKVKGTTGKYYGSGYFLPDANSGTNRGEKMELDSISGTGIASNLLIASDGQSAANTLQYTGNSDTVSLNLNLQFEFESGLSWHYLNNTNVFGHVNKKKQIIPNGTYYATFRLYMNGTVIYYQPLTLNTGSPQAFTIATQILSKKIKFGDVFQFEIFYSTLQPYVYGDIAKGSDSDGYLLVFSISKFNLSVSNDNATPVYGLLKKSYSNTSFPTTEQGNSLYNVEEMSPARLLNVHSPYILSLLYNRKSDSLIFQTGDKNTSFSTTFNGVTISEGTSIPISSLPGSPLFYPFYFEFETKVPLTFMQLFGSAANSLIKFEFVGNTFYGFPMDVKVKPALNDSQQWKLLCAPITDLSQLVDIEYNSLNNIEFMANGTAISKVSPIRFVPMGFTPPAQYNFLHIDQAWFINQVQFYVSKDNYTQKWQKNDTWNLQLITVGLGPVVGQIIDSNGIQVATFNFTSISDPSVVSPNTLWQAEYALTGLAEGIYYLLVTSGTGSTTTIFISEPQEIKTIWTKTMLFEYSDSRNKQGVIFSTNYTPSFRVESWLSEYTPAANFTEYEDQEADLQMLNAIPFLTKILNVGRNKGIPPWVIQLLSRIMLLETVKIDGIAHSREKEANWEKIDIAQYPMKNWKIAVREKQNSDFITLTTDGALNSDLLVAYNIDTAAFGNGSGGSNVVQVTEVNG